MDICSAPVAVLTSNARGSLPRPTSTSTHTNERRACRVCGRSNLLRYLDFGLQALANDYRSADEALGPRFPLAVQACSGCKLSQLTYTVPKETLYTNYAYSSGVNAGWQRHCAALAEEYAKPDAFVVEIASNDGTCLREFAKHGCRVLGVEPSQSFADRVSVDTLKHWWTRALAERANLTDSADILVAQNVLGHVDDVHDFVEGIALALKVDGIAILEVPYLDALLNTLAFDTIYHEHLSYWSVTALRALLSDHGLVLRDVQELAVHGGSIRAIIAKSGAQTQAVTRLLVAEHHDLSRTAYIQFSSRVSRRIAEISAELAQHTPYVGFGAPAKATVMLGVLDVRAYPRVVYDETPAKQGKLIPGTRVPIEPMPTNWRTAPGPLCCFAWNWADGIVPKLRKAGYAGAIYVPLPKPRWER